MGDQCVVVVVVSGSWAFRCSTVCSGRRRRLLLLLLLVVVALVMMVGREDMLVAVEVSQSPTPAALSAASTVDVRTADWQSGDSGVGLVITR